MLDFLAQRRMASDLTLQILAHMLIHPDDELLIERVRPDQMNAMTVVLGQSVILGVHTQATLRERQLHLDSRVALMLYMIVPQDLDRLVDERHVELAPIAHRAQHVRHELVLVGVHAPQLDLLQRTAQLVILVRVVYLAVGVRLAVIERALDQTGHHIAQVVHFVGDLGRVHLKLLVSTK